MKLPPEAEARRWLDQASVDLHWAEHLAQEGGFHLACFLAQQVGEKALKAYLYFRGEELVLGYSVDRLAAQCEGFDPAFGDQRPKWSVLDAYYVSTRYPNALPDSIPARIFDRGTAERAVGLAREIVTFVEARVQPCPGVHIAVPAGLILIALKRRSRKDPIPFGPALAGGGIVAVLWGQAIVNWYLGL